MLMIMRLIKQTKGVQEKPKVFLITWSFYGSIKGNHGFCYINFFGLRFDAFILGQYSVLQLP
jgi:hypothetical protein